jgi:hypothetical protein
MSLYRVLLGLLSIAFCNHSHAECFTTLAELKANNVATTYRESSKPGQGGPLIITLYEKNGIKYKGVKDGEGWIQGSMRICRSDKEKIVLTLDNTRPLGNGPLGIAMLNNRSVTINKNQFTLEVPWRGSDISFTGD